MPSERTVLRYIKNFTTLIKTKPYILNYDIGDMDLSGSGLIRTLKRLQQYIRVDKDLAVNYPNVTVKKELYDDGYLKVKDNLPKKRSYIKVTKDDIIRAIEKVRNSPDVSIEEIYERNKFTFMGKEYNLMPSQEEIRKYFSSPGPKK
ncbi:hypothetical protein [Spirosoma arboris]|nr:hypothetical protein [Spirosoma arboris]